jgi:peptide/nickel transport system substrate-binding protein
LGESGLSAGRTLTLLVNEENSFKVSAAQQVAETFSGYGIPMIVRTLPWAEYTAALAAGEFDLYYGEIKLTADWDLSHILGTDAALNYGGWADPLFDQYLSAYRSATNRSAAMERICSYLRNQAPIMPICFKSTSVLLQTDVLEGLEPTMNEPFYNLAECTIYLAEN